MPRLRRDCGKPMSVPTISCPQCGTPSPYGSRFCEEDGTRLPSLPPPPQACYCGVDSKIDSDGFCETCGLKPIPTQIQGKAILGADLAIATDMGKKYKRNEDAGGVIRAENGAIAVIVSDGVGSASSSNKLSALLVSKMQALAPKILMLDPQKQASVEAAVVHAIRTVHLEGCQADLPAENGKEPPGATFVAAFAWPSTGDIVVGWLGDSRAYWIEGEDAIQLTRDDSWMADQMARGMPESEAKASRYARAITHCLGPLEGADDGVAHPEILPHIQRHQRTKPGRLVVCSDGLWIYTVELLELAGRVRAYPDGVEMETIVASLVQHALDQGGEDNVTVGIAALSAV